MRICKKCDQETLPYSNQHCRKHHNEYHNKYRKANARKVNAIHLKSRMAIYYASWEQRVKDAANRAVRSAIQKGLITPTPCACGEEKTHAHHDSYLKRDRLKVRFLCKDCHALYHRTHGYKMPRKSYLKTPARQSLSPIKDELSRATR